MLKRASAWLLDVILLSVLATGFALLLSAAFGYDNYKRRHRRSIQTDRRSATRRDPNGYCRQRRSHVRSGTLQTRHSVRYVRTCRGRAVPRRADSRTASAVLLSSPCRTRMENLCVCALKRTSAYFMYQLYSLKTPRAITAAWISHFKIAYVIIVSNDRPAFAFTPGSNRDIICSENTGGQRFPPLGRAIG